MPFSTVMKALMWLEQNDQTLRITETPNSRDSADSELERRSNLSLGTRDFDSVSVLILLRDSIVSENLYTPSLIWETTSSYDGPYHPDNQRSGSLSGEVGPDAEKEDSIEYPGTLRVTLVLLFLSLSTFIIALDGTVINVAVYVYIIYF
jgi:hypothetical protein